MINCYLKRIISLEKNIPKLQEPSYLVEHVSAYIFCNINSNLTAINDKSPELSTENNSVSSSRTDLNTNYEDSSTNEMEKAHSLNRIKISASSIVKQRVNSKKNLINKNNNSVPNETIQNIEKIEKKSKKIKKQPSQLHQPHNQTQLIQKVNFFRWLINVDTIVRIFIIA